MTRAASATAAAGRAARTSGGSRRVTPVQLPVARTAPEPDPSAATPAAPTKALTGNACTASVRATSATNVATTA